MLLATATKDPDEPLSRESVCMHVPRTWKLHLKFEARITIQMILKVTLFYFEKLPSSSSV